MVESTARGASPSSVVVPVPAYVKSCRRQAPNVWTLELEVEADRHPIAPGLPGQFNMLYVMGVGEIPISIGGETKDGARIHTIRAVGAVSDAIANLQPGQSLGIRGPFGRPWPLDAAAGRDVLIVGGGLGLAPLRPLIDALIGQAERYGRITVLYGSRSPQDILFGEDLSRWRREGAATVRVTVDHATMDWDGPVGVVPALISTALFDPARATAMICGPEVMMRFTVDALIDAGLPAEAIYLSMERNMKCAVGHCGHCQFGPDFVCKEGPVFRFDRIRDIFRLTEI